MGCTFNKLTFLTTIALAATVPFNMGGCADTASQFGGAIGGQQGAVIGRSLGGAGEAASLSQKDEQAMGESVAAAVTTQYPVVKDAKLNQYVALVGLTLANASKRPDGNWLFAVVDSNEVNAFSGPDGYIMITRGALKEMRDEAELAGVLAHEISHVLDEHGLKAAKQAGITSSLANLSNLDQRSNAFGELASGLADTVLNKGYGRQQEDEADADAVKLMISTGYDPNSYLHFIERIAKSQGSARGASVLMKTHPGAAERADKIRKRISELAPAKQGAVLRERFAKMTAGK